MNEWIKSSLCWACWLCSRSQYSGSWRRRRQVQDQSGPQRETGSKWIKKQIGSLKEGIPSLLSFYSLSLVPGSPLDSPQHSNTNLEAVAFVRTPPGSLISDSSALRITGNQVLSMCVFRVDYLILDNELGVLSLGTGAVIVPVLFRQPSYWGCVIQALMDSVGCIYAVSHLHTRACVSVTFLLQW